MNEGPGDSYELACKLDDIPAGCGLPVKLGGHRIALFRTGDGIRAIGDACPHQGTPLFDGRLGGGTITCSHHGWEFDLHTGKCLNFPESCVMTYELKIEDGEIWVKLR